MERWVGKVAVVSGASAGIGAAIVEQFVRDGLQVVGLARRKERVEDLSKKLQHEKGKLYSLKTDVTNEEEVLNAFEWIKKNLGPVHILVNNVGIFKNTDLINGDYQKWKETIDTNVLGLCLLTREAVKNMKENNIDGHIVHINSLAGHRVPNTQMPKNVYPASKYAVTALTETLRQELNNNKLKIKITSISPGLVATEIAQAGDLQNIDFNKMPALQPQDIADAVRYVVSTPSHVQSISPGSVVTEIAQVGDLQNFIDFNKLSALQPKDIAYAVRYIVSTPPHVQVHELMIKSLERIQ